MYLGRHIITIGRLVSEFTTKMTGWRTFGHLILWHFWRWRKLKSWMHKFAHLSVRTKSSQIICTQHSSNMPVPTVWTMSTEATIIPRAIFDLAFGVDMQKWTFFVVAGIETGIEIAFGHFCHVVFVQKFTLISFFA